MGIIDISHDLQKAPLYPQSPAPQINKLCDRALGQEYNETEIKASVHTGTHADAFCHFMDDGLDIAQMGLEYYVGLCYVMDLTDSDQWQEALKERLPMPSPLRLLIKSGGRFYSTIALAQWFSKQGVKTIGTDGISVGNLDNETEGHESLMANHIAILENLNLANVSEGWYFLSAAPIKLSGSDGGLVRAILLDMDRESLLSIV